MELAAPPYTEWVHISDTCVKQYKKFISFRPGFDFQRRKQLLQLERRLCAMESNYMSYILPFRGGELSTGLRPYSHNCLRC